MFLRKYAVSANLVFPTRTLSLFAFSPLTHAVLRGTFAVVSVCVRLGAPSFKVGHRAFIAGAAAMVTAIEISGLAGAAVAVLITWVASMVIAHFYNTQVHVIRSFLLLLAVFSRLLSILTRWLLRRWIR